MAAKKDCYRSDVLLAELSRMCDNYKCNEYCIIDKCPAERFCGNESGGNFNGFFRGGIDSIAFVQAWSDTHPESEYPATTI